MPNIETLQNNATITASGSAVFRADPSQDVTLFWRIAGPVTGTAPTIAFTLTEVDPSDETTQAGNARSTQAITAASSGFIALRGISSPVIKVSWAVTGTTPSFAGVFLVMTSKATGTYSPPGDGAKMTYSACATSLAAVNLATDLFTISGSATKLVKVVRISITGISTGGNMAPITLLKRSTANTGGTSATITSVPHLSTDPAATAVVTSYTANPTTGTLVGTLRSMRVSLPASGLSGANTPQDLLAGTLPGCRAWNLIGAGELLAVNQGGATFTGASWSIEAEWTEE